MSLVSRTNLHANPSFEVSTAGINPYGNTGAAVARVTTQFFVGVASLQATQGNAGITEFGYNIGALVPLSIAAGNLVTASTYFRVPSANTGVLTGCRFTFRDGPNANSFSTQTTATTTEDAWTQFSARVIVPGGLTCTQIFFIAVAAANWAAADVAFFDASMIEIGGALQPAYFDGSTANDAELTHAWTGTTGLSASTEAITTRRVLNQGSLTQSAVRAATI